MRWEQALYAVKVKEGLGLRDSDIESGGTPEALSDDNSQLLEVQAGLNYMLYCVKLNPTMIQRKRA